MYLILQIALIARSTALNIGKRSEGPSEEQRLKFLPPDQAFNIHMNCNGATEEICKGAKYYC